MASERAASSGKFGIWGALLWPAAGLVLTIPTLILQWPSPDFLERILWLLDAPGLLSVAGPEGRGLLLHPLIELFYVLALITTPIAIVLFFRRSRLTKPVMIAWFLLGIGMALGTMVESKELLSVYHSHLLEGSSPSLYETAAKFIAWPSMLLIPVLKIPALIHSDVQFTYPHLGALVAWLLYFVLSRRVSNTFTN